jgi:hypothetical protein
MMNNNKKILEDLWDKVSECERCPNRFIENNYLDKKILDGEARVGKSLC